MMGSNVNLLIFKGLKCGAKVSNKVREAVLYRE